MSKRRWLSGALGGVLFLTGGLGLADTDDQAVAEAPDADTLAFALENMDPAVDPADDFARYASGGWFDRVARPQNQPVYGFMQIIGDRIGRQMASVLAQAAAEAPLARKGTAQQQIGMLYASYVDTAQIDATGMAPLTGELAQLDAVKTKAQLARYLGDFSVRTATWPFVEVSVFEDLSDVTRQAVYIGMGERALALRAIFDSPEGSEIRAIYRNYVTAMLEAGNVPTARAKSIAVTALAIDTMLQEGELDPVKKVDKRNINNPRTMAALKAEAGDFAIEDYLHALGFKTPERVILTDPQAAHTLAKVMAAFSLEDLKGYLRLRLIQSFSSVLSTRFEAPKRDVNIALLGAYADKPREQSAMEFIETALAQPLGRLYVENFFTRAQERAGLDMIGRIQSAFRARIEANVWMEDATREAALAKVDALYYRVGYPDTWIDYSAVEIGEDPVRNLMNLHTFEMARMVAKLDGPVEVRAFSEPKETTPTVVNAAYNPLLNGFEVTAAIAQPPVFSADRDAPLYFCRLGAIIGHEMTHGFDTGGRNFDADGNLRNWWTEKDERRFEAETRKLVDQGNAYEVLPGTYMNGALTVTENLADIGGIALAHDALMGYLAQHPEENVAIGGLSPSQRCFIAYSQLWAEQRSEGALRAQLEDNHAPGAYRAFAPLLHVDAFYEAFGVKEGDTMWLAPEKRVDIW